MNKIDNREAAGQLTELLGFKVTPRQVSKARNKTGNLFKLVKNNPGAIAILKSQEARIKLMTVLQVTEVIECIDCGAVWVNNKPVISGKGGCNHLHKQ